MGMGGRKLHPLYCNFVLLVPPPTLPFMHCPCVLHTICLQKSVAAPRPNTPIYLPRPPDGTGRMVLRSTYTDLLNVQDRKALNDLDDDINDELDAIRYHRQALILHYEVRHRAVCAGWSAVWCAFCGGECTGARQPSPTP